MADVATTTKACQDCGVQIPVLQIGDWCGPCQLAWVDGFNAVEGAA
jgi:hypothetical protein